MRQFFVFITLITALSCSNNNNTPQDKLSSANDFEWLEGKWIRTNDKIGKKTFENWKRIGTNIYSGLGYTLMNSDTTFKEDLRLIKSDGTWTFEVRGVNAEMTPFVFIEQTDTSFICENNENEFPKKIKYVYSNNTLTAIISDENMEIPFIFEKVNQ